MAEELTNADIQQAFFEYRANFREPIAPLWYSGGQGQIVSSLITALSPWQVGLENVTWNQGAKNAGEVQITVGIPALLASVVVGMGGVTLNAFNPDWARAPMLVSLFQAALDAVKASTGEEVQSQVTTLSFHLKPGTRPFREVLTEFVNVRALGGERANMFGVSVYSEEYAYVIDGSATFPGSAFIKLIRTFSAEKRLEEMAKTIYTDEEAVLRRIGLKLQ